MKNHILGISWTVASPVFPPSLSLNVSGEEGVEKYPISIGSTIDLKLSEEKWCIGYYDPDKGEWNSCPHKRGNVVKCESCRIKSGYPCHWEHQCDPIKILCKNMKIYENYCSSPHLVYLAHVGNIQKVGITQFYRRDVRFFELGADEAVILLVEENRMAAAKIEHEIYSKFKALGIKDQIRLNEENIGSFLKGPADMESDNFRRMVTDISSWLTKEKFKVPKIEWKDRDDFYYPKSPTFNEITKVKYFRFSNHIKGKIVQIKGSVIVLSINNEFNAFDIGNLAGHVIIEEGEFS